MTIPPQLLSIEDALDRLGEIVTPIAETEHTKLVTAAGRTLKNAVLAPIDMPPFDSSAMDGYALHDSVLDSGETTYTVIGESRAGHPFTGVVANGQCARIFTGAMLPKGANSVVLQEDVRRLENTITVSPDETIRHGMNIRFQASDVAKGKKLLHQGQILNDFHIGWLAACGVESVSTSRKPKIGLFSTGDELQDPGSVLLPGQIYDSNRISLQQLIRHHAVEIVDFGRLPDDQEITRNCIDQATQEVDLLLTSGGVSVGESDFVRPVVEEIGELTFWNIALKPGKPLAVGLIRDCVFFGLPGNPVSTIVTYLLFVNRAIELISGANPSRPLKLSAILTNDLHHSVGRREYQRGTLWKNDSELSVTTVLDQGSNRLTSFAEANCLVEVPESSGNLVAGSRVDVVLLSDKTNHIWSV